MKTKVCYYLIYLFFFSIELLFGFTRSSAFLQDILIFQESFDGSSLPSEWQTVGYASHDPQAGYSGASVRFDLTAQDWGGILRRDHLNLRPNTYYRMTWWCRTQNVTGSISASLEAFDVDANRTRIINFESDNQGGTQSWTYHEVIFITETNEVSGNILFRQFDEGQSWIDQVEFYEYESDPGDPSVITSNAQVLDVIADRDVTFWLNYPLDKVFRADQLSPTLPEDNTINIEMAKNEHESFQVVIHNGISRPASIYMVNAVNDLASPQGGVIPAENVTVCKVHYAQINERWVTNRDRWSRSGDYPDALKYESETTLSETGNIPFWITIETPADIPAGVYTGDITISGYNWRRFTLQVTVWDFALPEVPNFVVTGNDRQLHWPGIDAIDGRSEQERFADFAQNLLSHRLSGTRHVEYQLGHDFDRFTDWVTLQGNNQVRVDFDHFDTIVNGYLDLGYHTFNLPPGFFAMLDMPLGSRDFLSLSTAWNNGFTQAFRTAFTDYCNQLGQHLRQAGWLERAYFTLWDEPDQTNGDYEPLLDLHTLVRNADPGLNLLLTEQPEPDLYGFVDIWLPNLRRLSTETLTARIQDRLSNGETVGAYGNNRYQMLSSLTFQRLWAWTCKKYNLSRCDWWSILPQSPTPNSVWTDPVLPSGDQYYPNYFPGRGYFLYFDENNNGPYVNSMRWEALREGYEDYEYLVELERRLNSASPGSGGPEIQQIIENVVDGNMGEEYEKDMAVLQSLRHDIAIRITELGDDPGETTFDYNFPVPGWYMVSIPGTADDMHVTSLFSECDTPLAYSWQNSSYVRVDVFEPGEGYWLYVSNSGTQRIQVDPLVTYSRQLQAEQWILLGGLMTPVEVSNINQNPTGSLMPPCYHYHPENPVYTGSTLIEPQKAYWVYVLNNCSITLTTSNPLPQAPFVMNHESNLQPPHPPLSPNPTDIEDRQLSSVPDEFCLHQNYPNPFNPETVIEYALPEAMDVVVCVYNIRGELIRELSGGHREAGWHRVVWDGRDDAGSVVSSGVYLIEVTTGVEREVVKAMFLK
jgi:hypothetical protein